METVEEVNLSRDEWPVDAKYEFPSKRSQNKTSGKIWHVGPQQLVDCHEEYQKIAPFLFDYSQSKAHLALPRIDFNSVGVYKPRSSQVITSRVPAILISHKAGESSHRRCLSNSTASELPWNATKPNSRESSLPRLGSYDQNLQSKAQSVVRQQAAHAHTDRPEPSLPTTAAMQIGDHLQHSSSSLIVHSKEKIFDKVFTRHPIRPNRESNEWEGVRSRELSLNNFPKDRKEFSEPLPYVGTASNSMFSNLEMMEFKAPSLTENEALGTIHELYTDIVNKNIEEKAPKDTKIEGPRSSLKSDRRVLAKPLKLKTDFSVKDQISSPTLSHLKDLGSRNTSFRKLDTTTQHTLGTVREPISERTHKKRIGLSNSTPQILGHISNQIEDYAIRDRMLARESRERFKELASLFRVQQRQKGKYGHLSTKASMQDDEMTALLGTGSFYDKKMSASSHQDLSDTRSFKEPESRHRSPKEKPNQGSTFLRYQNASKFKKSLPRTDSETPSVRGPPQLVVLEPEKPKVQLISESSEDGGFRLKPGDLNKDPSKQDPFVANEGPTVPIELSRISAPMQTSPGEKPKKKVATINSIDDYSFTSQAPSQRQVPLKGAIKIRASIVEGHRPSKGSLFSIKEDQPGVSGSTDAAGRKIVGHNLHPGHHGYGSSFRTLHPNRNSLFRRPSQIQKGKKPLFRSNAEQEAIEHSLSSLRTNLEILKALFPVTLEEFVDLLGGVTRNNPCAALLGKFLREGKEPSEIRVGVFLPDPQLKQNLPLMLADLKEFLIERRVSLLEHLAKSYLSNSVEFMKSSKLYQSALIKRELMKILQDRESIQSHPEFKLTGNDSIKLVGLHHNHRIQDLVTESDSSKVMKLDKVNEYWKESNTMINDFLTQLLHPQDMKRQKVKLPDSLVQEFEQMRVQNSVLSFHWQQPTSKQETMLGS